MSFFIQPLENVKLVDWLFDRQPIDKKFEPPYFVYFSYALDPTPLRFHLEFQVSKQKKKKNKNKNKIFFFLIKPKHDTKNWSGPTFDIAVMGHNVHTSNFTDEFKEFLSAFPKWSYVTAWLSSYHSWRL